MRSTRIVALLLFVGSFLAGCDLSHSFDDEDMIASSVDFLPDDSHPGLLKVTSSGRTVFLGTKSSDALLTERPLMKASFTYDFSIGKSEVTCREFNEVLRSFGYEALGSQPCDQDSLPVVNVSYFDAVLFCNARSKAEKLDTVYSYGSALYDETGHCTGLEGLVTNFDRNGYRLPTEAEWMIVAAQVWNSSESWTSENSDGKLHKVCSSRTPSLDTDVCDMKGNAMEWVADWLGYFGSQPVTDFAGSPYGSFQGARVVKGGSYRNSDASLRLFRRGDVYTVTSSTRAEYVGFRIAQGKIERPTWLMNGGTSSSRPIAVLASSQSVKEWVGSYNSKLAFRNGRTGNLAYVNFANGNLVVSEIQDDLEVYHPDISPDGKKVAFCTGMEGTDLQSQIYVRDLSVDGGKLVKLDVESAAIPRWRVLDNGDTVIVYVSSAENNKDENNFKRQSTWQVSFAKGVFGTPEKLFDGAYHGGVSIDNQLAVSGARLLRAKVNSRDTVWYDGEQACNVSLSRNDQKKTLFLDFGGKPGMDFAGEKYGVHEMLLVADSLGQILQMIPSPAGYSFDHSEWALCGDSRCENLSSLAAVSIVNANGAHEKIALVDLRDSSVLELVEGEELWHPCFWSSPSTLKEKNMELDLDSAGVYLVPGGAYHNECVRVKMELLWKYSKRIEYLCVGSSRMAEGMIPDILTAGFSVNMGHSHNDLNASVYIAENYGLNILPELKTIVIGVDFDLWHLYTHNSDDIFNAAPGYAYDYNHDFWKNGVPDYFVEAVENSYPANEGMQAIYYESRGFSASPSAGWGDPLIDVDIRWDEVHTDYLELNLGLLRDLVEKADAKGIYVVGVIFPQNPKYRETPSWGRYGPKRSTAESLKDSVIAMTKKYSNFVLLDENRMGLHDYTDSMALNTDHLSERGAAHLTQRLDSLLKTLQ